MHNITLSMRSVTLHEIQELACMNSVDLFVKSEVNYLWIMFTCKKPIIFCEWASQLSKFITLHIDSFF